MRSVQTALGAASLLLTCAVLAAETQPTTPATRPSTQPSTQPTTQPTTRPTTRPLGLTGGEAPLKTLPQTSTSGLLWQMLAYVVIILILGGVGVYIARRVGPRGRLRGGGGRNVAVAETVHLGPQRAVHVLKVGRRRYLVGATREQIHLLADVTHAINECPESERPSG